MRKLFPVISMFVVLMAALIFAAPAAAAQKQLCFVMPNATHGFLAAAIQYAREGLVRVGAEYPDVETRLLTAADTSEQSNQLATLINEGVDTIILWPIDGDPLRSAAQSVIDAGIKLVIFDRLIPDIDPISEVDMDNIAYGAFCANAMNEFFKDRLDAGEKIQILELRGDMNTPATMRHEGFMATKHDNIEIVQSVSTIWQRAVGLEFMESFLTNNSVADIEAIDAIFSHDGEPTAGAFDAIVNYNGPASLENLKLVAGVGADTIAVRGVGEMLERGITYIICFVPPSLTDYGIAVGFDVISGREVPKQVKVGLMEITADNYEELLADEDKLFILDVRY